MHLLFLIGTPWLEAVGPMYHHWAKGYFEYTGEKSSGGSEVVDEQVFVMATQAEPETQLFALALSDLPGGSIRVSVRAVGANGTLHRVPKVYEDFLDVFSEEEAAKLPLLGGPEHVIDTTEDPPWGPIYPLSKIQLDALKKYITMALERGWIVPSKSPAGAPILFAPKKDGGLRLCVDYRGLNKVTIKNRHPLPLITETLDRLVGAAKYTKLDLKDAYHRI
jgi:hypothetical protein